MFLSWSFTTIFSLEPAKHYWFWGECRYRLCKCDASAVRMFAKSPYQRKYKNYPQKKCKKDKHAKPEKAEKAEGTENPEKSEETEKPMTPKEMENAEKPGENEIRRGIEKAEVPGKPRNLERVNRTVHKALDCGSIKLTKLLQCY